MPPPSRFARCLFLVVSALVLLAACGGDDDPELSTETVPTATPDPGIEATPDGAATPTGEVEAGADDPVGEPTTEPTDDPAADGGGGSGEEVAAPTQAPVSGDPAFTSASKLSTVGLDEVFFGDPVELASEQTGTDWVGLPEPGENPDCYTIQPANGPAGVVFTVFAGRIERVDITNPIITTRSGAGVGSTPESLAELFGDRVEEAALDDGGSEITFVPADADDREYRIIWRTDGVAAVSMRAGRLPVVLPSTPCG